MKEIEKSKFVRESPKYNIYIYNPKIDWEYYNAIQ